MSDHNATSAAAYSRRNFVLGVINGAIWIGASALIDARAVLPAFALDLTGRVMGVGILAAASAAGWAWPPVLLSPLMQRTRVRMVYYHISAALRIAIVWALVIVTMHARRGSSLPLWVVGGLLLALTSAGGLGLLPFMSVVADSIPARLRGKFFGMRWFFGGLLSLAAGAYVKRMLSPASDALFPMNYARLFAVAAALMTVSLSVFAFAEEWPHPVRHRTLPLPLQWRWGARLLVRDHNFRRLIAANLLTQLAFGLTTPFLVPFALKRLNVDPQGVGLFVSVSVLALSLSNILWSRISDGPGNRLVLSVASAIYVLAPIMALTAPLFPTQSSGHFLGMAVSPAMWWMLGIFGVSGFAQAGLTIGITNYLLELSPEPQRLTYLAFFYLSSLPNAFWPIAGAALIGEGGRYLAAFAFALVLAMAMLVNALRLDELREKAPQRQAPQGVPAH
ncbi:MAG: MFS transporter [Armatimonadetes bacterium]|nr:MFS transporter [Armatimonadota bacterium]